MTPEQATKIVARADTLPLYLHAYAYHLNMRLERILPEDLLEIAHRQGLHGVKVHVLDGESRSLAHASAERLTRFGAAARRLGLDIHIETSASDSDALAQAIAIAEGCGASSVRFYPRYEGALSQVLSQIRADIQTLRQHHRHSGLRFTLEQHEDLKSHELAALIAESDFPALSLLFDFANMINANEEPSLALRAMAPHVTQVHIKDARITREARGLGHQACISGQGEMPMRQLLTELICLGETQPQVTAYGLEEEVDYYAPPARFADEGADPWIPWRAMSETPLPQRDLAQRLAQEQQDALNQIHYVRTLVQDIKREALNLIN